MGEDYFGCKGGVLSDADIQREIKNGNIFIAPFVQAQLQPSGYNLTPTRFFYSTKKKQFLPVIENEEETYVVIDKNDTVLVRTRESISISHILSGAFYSKVKVVSEGFGHVSTTLDPSWEGQLLISLNNPTNKKHKFSIEKEVYGKRICNSFVTLEFMYLNEPALNLADNPPGRLDILDSTIERNISRFKKGKISDLENLVEQLHEQETRTIESLIMSHLNEGEKEEWEQINIIRDDKIYNTRRSNFFRDKKEKYLRVIQDDFLQNSIRSIEIVNEYINKKQKYISIRKRFVLFVINHLYVIFNAFAFTVLSVILIVSFLTEKNGENNSVSFYTFISGIILSLAFPLIIKPIGEFIKDRL